MSYTDVTLDRAKWFLSSESIVVIYVRSEPGEASAELKCQ